MKRTHRAVAVRRSVALPRDLVEEVLAVADPEHGDNLNLLVVHALRDYVRRRRQQEFARAMAEMASDPAVRKECARIGKEFERTEADGLPEEP